MRKIFYFFGALLGAAFVTVFLALLFLKMGANGFSAREQPGAFETFVATQAREFALPAEARDKPNPVPVSDEVLKEAREHWADHCAICHSNDGSGDVPMGQKMYPPAPDMRQPVTQKKTDGELFFIIENGIRLSGMPGWGGTTHGQQDSWKLVHLIRRLPGLSRAEIDEMEKLNPKSPADLEEERQEDEFLKGHDVKQPMQHDHE